MLKYKRQEIYETILNNKNSTGGMYYNSNSLSEKNLWSMFNIKTHNGLKCKDNISATNRISIPLPDHSIAQKLLQKICKNYRLGKTCVKPCLLESIRLLMNLQQLRLLAKTLARLVYSNSGMEAVDISQSFLLLGNDWQSMASWKGRVGCL